MERLITTFHHDNTTDTSNIQFPQTQPKGDPSQPMTALRWYGNKDIRAEQVPKPMITEPKDAIIRITATTVCGSDLHLYHNEFYGLTAGDIMGHEPMGIVEAVGSEVTSIRPGDRVVISFDIACGQCEFCKKQYFSCCDRTNPSKYMEKLYGHRTAGIFGYSGLLGSYPGGYAEYLRVPFADMCCLKVPDNLRDEQVLFLSDIACTGWHGNECADVQRGDVVAIWGMGPVGLMAAMWAKFRGASRVIVIDHVPYRLEFAKQKFGCEPINFETQDVVATIQQLVPGGPDKCIDAAGFRFPKSVIHKVQRLFRFETDAPQVLNEMIVCCKKGGRIGIVGDYYAYCNQFFIGAFMEKSLTMMGGQAWVQKYWKQILRWVVEGKVDLSWAATHTMPLSQGSKAYSMFDTYYDNCIKIVLRPDRDLVGQQAGTAGVASAAGVAPTASGTTMKM